LEKLKDRAVPKLNNEEREILQSLEAGEWESRGHTDERLKELQRHLRNQKKRAISIRISENDLYALKKKALENAIPYQNLIQMLIHQYSSGKLKLSA
jgi:predicted DNA binding CopG/RHH family protein